MVRGIHHAAISTPDVERLLAFYRGLMGFEVVHDFEFAGETADEVMGLRGSAGRLVLLRAGNALVELFEFASPTPNAAGPGRPVCDHGITHMCFDVVDVDAEYEHLTAAGMVFHCPPKSISSVRTTYGRDPDGNVIELQEILDASGPIPALPFPEGSRE